ncbi:uncharacterized protein VTP21DRAFT_5326 [Calcarisporiella thermophila]|uniref:uncharacterized protein n=1 Tax=Calcarisporiella thermophila TaxID=911321 RepID=UPI00374226D7
MHLFFENIAPLMYSHWAGDFSLPEGADINQEHILSTPELEEIGASMQACRKKIPTSFGRPPRNVYKFSKGYKAEEWMDWVIMYSLVFLNVAAISPAVERLPASWTTEKSFWLDHYEEELYWPRKFYELDGTEFHRLKEYYATIYECNIFSLEDVPRTGYQYVRLRTKDGHYISSKKFRNESEDYWRNNYTVAAIFQVDRNARFQNWPEDMVKKECYAEVEVSSKLFMSLNRSNYYFHHKFREKDLMLAFVRWAKDWHKGAYDLRSFDTVSSVGFIGVEALDRCVVDKKGITNIHSG